MIRRGKETIFEKNGAGQLIKKFKERDVHPVQIAFTPEEDDLYKAVSGYTGDGWAELNRKRKISAADLNIGKFLLALVQKRMVSSLAALRETLKRRIDSIVVTRTLSRVSGDRPAPDRQEIQRPLERLSARRVHGGRGS